ncbi:unnamed protein product [Boreogadus saida]
MNGDMEAKGIVLRELSCRTAAELPPPELRASAAVQLPEYTAGAAELPLAEAPAGGARQRSSPRRGGAAGKLRRQFSSRSTPPGLPNCLWRKPRRGELGKERDCTPGAELPGFCQVPPAGAAQPALAVAQRALSH